MTTSADNAAGPALPGCLSTMIGSLPHHNIDAALAMAFQVDVAFLPQIPIRNPWEFMIAQALDGMPGLTVEKDGATTLDIGVWTGRAHALNERLLAAFASSSRASAFEAFEPGSATSSSWQPFLWELHERGAKVAKIQLAGPLTCQWVLRLSDGSSASRHSDVTSQIYRLVLARALAMARRLQADGIQPVLFLDEPGLYGFMPTDPRHLLALQELKLLVQALRKENVIVGLHCCSDTDWASVLSLELSYLSLDTGLSLPSLLARSEALEQFLKGGGRLSLGVIPTDPSHGGAGSFEPAALFEGLLTAFARSPLGAKPPLVKEALQKALYTPACGLAMHTAGQAEAALTALVDFTKLARRSFN
jgi:methionine synthase II (cobalamin-independent)